MKNNPPTSAKDSALKELQIIPWVGKSIAGDLFELGIHQVKDLVGKDPQALYEEHCRQRWCIIDRCVLYTFRGAVYYASNTVHDPELLKWWNWKD